MSKADEMIDLCNAHIDLETGGSQTAMQRKLEMSVTEKRIKELQQYKCKELGWIDE